MREGHSVWPQLREFLGEYSGLLLTFERNGRLAKARFDPEHAARWIARPWMDGYEARVNRNWRRWATHRTILISSFSRGTTDASTAATISS